MKFKKYAMALIIGNEFCERFCYYGIRSSLFMFLRQSFKLKNSEATALVHIFNFLCFTFTFFGAICSDMILGRYQTIVYLSMVYYVGMMMLVFCALFHSSLFLLLTSLVFIALGTGGIKPNVSTFGGDQFRPDQIKEVERFFSIFYFAINTGSMLSLIITPILSNYKCMGMKNCYPLAFGVPMIVLIASIMLFIAGSNYYIKVKPTRDFYYNLWKFVISKSGKLIKKDKPNLENILFNSRIENDEYENDSVTELIHNEINGEETEDNCNNSEFIETAPTMLNRIGISEFSFNIPAVEDTSSVMPFENKAMLEKFAWESLVIPNKEVEFKKKFDQAFKVIKTFAPASIFWMLYDQQASVWIDQATRMNSDFYIHSYKLRLIPSQMQSVNAVLVLILIPIFSFLIYPLLGSKFNPLMKMSVGMFIASTGFILSAVLEFYLNYNENVSMLWQIPQYLLLTIGEVMLSITGLEFAYSESPEEMKGFVLAGWLMMVAIGNFFVIFFTLIDLGAIIGKITKTSYIQVYNTIIYAIIGIIASYLIYNSSKKYKRKNMIH
ncbi:Peptide transporter family 1 [Astathelohania contejeani]|uniref:Peptide transporter family 1 n=1 Tax=Astathelohania contejeani TaxID=164912 RepID=A0ABQ7HX34_9MICR|nr:Peptide transporter family 1 [Thelohania contejeani]